MGVFGKYTVVLSDDERYVTGSTYDVYLDTASTPEPAAAGTGTLPGPAASGAPQAVDTVAP